MRRRELGRTGLQVSELGYGAWGIGKTLWGPTDDAQSRKALMRALELGVDFFDTAYVYGDGHSERLIAQAFRDFGSRKQVATKVPPKNSRWPGAGEFADAFPADWIRRCTERSLKNLATDRVDVQQLHVWRDEWIGRPGWDESLSAMQDLTREGKVRFWGVSINARQPGTALDLVRSGLVATVQVIFNLFEQQPLEALFPLCREKGVGIIARVPLDEGGLTGNLAEDAQFGEEDFRRNYFAGGRLKETIRRAKALEHILVADGAPNLAHAALRFCLSFPEVSTIIPGMRAVGHVEANAKAAAEPPYAEEFLEKLRAHAWKRDW